VIGLFLRNFSNSSEKAHRSSNSNMTLGELTISTSGVSEILTKTLSN